MNETLNTSFRTDLTGIQKSLTVLKDFYGQAAGQTASPRLREKCDGAVYAIDYAIKNVFPKVLFAEKSEEKSGLERLTEAMTHLSEEKHVNEKCGGMFDAESLIYSAYMGRAFGFGEVLLRLAPLKAQLMQTLTEKMHTTADNKEAV